MNRIMILTSVLAIAMASACGDDNTDAPTDSGTGADAGSGSGSQSNETTVRVSDDIKTNTTWTADKTYILPRLKTVFVMPGATLTIEPGTVVQGEQGSVLAVARGAKIKAEGTADKPILLTTVQPSGQKTPGYWGGLLVLGAAPINVNANSNPASAEATFEAFTSAIPEGKFGGTDPHDSSGVLKYVRIEFAGFNFVSDREFNNLTLCGVGDGTVIDYVQVHGGSDDGLELFGGTVNLKHIVSSQNQDDGFDTDNGWTGNGQFIIVQNISHPASLPEASNGYESDNHGSAASYTAVPRTLPTLSNVTLLGDHSYTGVASYAAVFRRGTGGHYLNHIWAGFPLGPEIRDQETLAQVTAGNLTVSFSMLYNNDAAANGNLPAAQANGDIDEKLVFNSAANIQMGVDPGLPAEAFSKTAPSFKPVTNAAALTAGTAPPNNGFFDTTATFAGAIGNVDWTAGWTKYPQN